MLRVVVLYKERQRLASETFSALVAWHLLPGNEILQTLRQLVVLYSDCLRSCGYVSLTKCIGKITASRTTRPTNRIQQSSEGKAPKTPIHASTALKTSQSAGKPVKPSVSTRRTPHETTTSGPKAVVKTSTRSVSATSSNDPSLSNQPVRSHKSPTRIR